MSSTIETERVIENIKAVEEIGGTERKLPFYALGGHRTTRILKENTDLSCGRTTSLRGAH